MQAFQNIIKYILVFAAFLVVIAAISQPSQGQTPRPQVAAPPAQQHAAETALHEVEVDLANTGYQNAGFSGWFNATSGRIFGHIDISYGVYDSQERVIGFQGNWQNLQVKWPSCFTTDMPLPLAKSIKAPGNPAAWLHTNNVVAFSGQATVYASCRHLSQLNPY